MNFKKDKLEIKTFETRNEMGLNAAKDIKDCITSLLSKKDEIINNAKKYISANTNCSVVDVARECNISEPYLYLLFKENVGCSPNDYRLKAKCKRGIEYLLTTDKTVEEISALIGLSSASHFRRILKTHVGVTPKEVRKNSDF